MTEQVTTNADSLVGRTVVEMGLATEQEVQDVLQLLQQLSQGTSHRSLADLLVSNGVVTERQMLRVRQEVEARRSPQQIPGYEILEKLGAGAMATVFKARQVSLDRIVAIKILPKKYMADPQFIERFYAEGRAAAKLNHANIVQAIDVGKAGDFHYFVMEYVEGTTVFDYLMDKGPYSEADALDIVIQIAEALNHAHSRGFMHRDVKPKNMMLTSAGVAKLADMGLARAVSDTEAAEAEAGKAYGTPYYISPEQIRGEKDVDFRADIYGLGATFYHMVTGKVPFEGANPSVVMHKHLKQPLTPPDHVNKQLSAGSCEVIEVMMAKKREERYASTADLLSDLKAVAAGEPPLQARHKFELAQLTAIEETGQDMTPPYIVEKEPQPLLLEQPVFWVAAGAVMVNLILVVILILVLMRMP